MILKCLRSRSSRRSPNPRPDRNKLTVESLEARNLLAVIIVNSADDAENDDGTTSLREAIHTANMTRGLDVIEFASPLDGQTITLENGSLEITDDLMIEGPGAERLTIDAAGNDPTPHRAVGDGSRIFTIGDENVTISGLTLTGGDSGLSGGAIRIGEGGDLSVDDVILTGNSAQRDGGAIRSDADRATIRNSIISGNVSLRRGGGISASYGLTIQDSIVSGNRAWRHGGGVFSQVDEYRAFIDNTTIEGNYAYERGGGLFIVTNQYEGNARVVNSTIQGNYAYDGGGVAGYGYFQIDRTTISGNSAATTLGTWIAGNGGGLFVARGMPTVTNSTISGNHSLASGGGVYVDISDGRSGINLTNSTISGNLAAFEGGGAIATSAPAAERTDGWILLQHATVTGNSSGISAPFDMTRVGRSIVAQNSFAGFPSPDFFNVGDNVEAIQAGYSLLGDGTSGLAPAPAGQPDDNGNLVGSADALIDPLLDELSDNGGKTLTHAPRPNSPAIDAGDPDANLAYLRDDQRGLPFSRISGISIDIGAVEVQPLPGDFDENEQLDCADANVLNASLFQPAEPASPFNLNRDFWIDHEDMELWRAFAGEMNLPSGQPYPAGDINLDGRVDTKDLNTMALHWNMETDKYCAGDADGTQRVDAADLNLVGRNWRVDVSGGQADAAAANAARVPRAALAVQVRVGLEKVQHSARLESFSKSRSSINQAPESNETQPHLGPAPYINRANNQRIVSRHIVSPTADITIHVPMSQTVLDHVWAST